MKTKKLLAFLLIAVLLMSVFGCTPAAEPDDQDVANTANPTATEGQPTEVVRLAS